MPRFSVPAFAAGLLMAGFATSAGASDAPLRLAQASQPQMQESPSGLRYMDTQIGTGARPQPRQMVVVHYTGWIYQNGQKGRKFDSSVDRGEPFEFQIGLQPPKVIRGWEEGVASMHVGGKRTMIIPPEMGYGSRGFGPIPANSTLMFDVELLAVR